MLTLDVGSKVPLKSSFHNFVKAFVVAKCPHFLLTNRCFNRKPLPVGPTCFPYVSFVVPRLFISRVFFIINHP